MKKIISLSVFFISACLLAFNVNDAGGQAPGSQSIEEIQARAMCVLGKKVESFPFYVYKDGNSVENNFFQTGNMGDFRTFQGDGYSSESPYEGSSCVKITYDVKQDDEYGWAGLYWQYPPNNWGNIPEAYDLTGAAKLTFWARGKYGGEVINKFQVGGIAGEYRDSGVASIGPITLSEEWKKYTIDLTRMNDSIIVTKEDRECWPFMEPLSRIVGGFCWATSMKANRNNSVTFYLDEIRFEAE